MAPACAVPAFRSCFRLFAPEVWGLALFALLALHAPAWAVDGVLEINQACAVNTGCFTGDAAGFPVTIDGSAGRSVRLTGDLQVSGANVTAILARVPDVTVDLNGFSIRGTTVCSGTPPFIPINCAPSGTGNGVAADLVMSPSPRGLEVRGGSIVGMGNNAVLLAEEGRAHDLRLFHNRGSGVEAAGPGSKVSHNTIATNGKDGVNVQDGSLVTGNVARQNGNRGIATGSGSTVQGNTSTKNEGIGIEADDGCTVLDNATEKNGLTGIVAGYGSTVSRNTAHSNGHKGISVAAGSRVSGNAIHKNTGTGLRLDSTAAYDNNSVVGNTANQVDGGVNRGGNFCNGPGTVLAECP